MANRGTDSAMPVGRDRDPDTGSAYENPAICPALPDGARQGVSIIGIIDRLRTLHTEIQDRIAPRDEIFGQTLLQFETGVI